MGDRGVSTVVGYTLTLAIVAVLASTLVAGFAPFVTGQQADAAASTLRVYGNDIAGDLASADRLATTAGDNGTVVLRTDLPDSVGGSAYRVEVDQPGGPGAPYRIRLRAAEFDASATVSVRTTTPVELPGGAVSLGGGPLGVRYDADADRLVIADA